MAIDMASVPKRVATIKEDVPKQRKRSRTGGSKDLYDGHSQDVMLAKTLIDPDHQCSVTTVKAYVTHVCAWFRYCRTLAEPNYTLVDEAKLSGFLTWATQTPRLPCKTGSVGSGGSMSYQSARRYVEGGILALWRRYRKADDENPLHALGYLNTKYAIREATAGERPQCQPERSYTALLVGPEQEDSIVRDLLSAEHDPAASIRAWAFYCLGAATWIPGTRRLHLRLDSLLMSLRTDARLVEHTTVPFLEFRVSPDPSAATARFAEVSLARHTNPLVCPWYAVAVLIFQQWQAQPSAMASASMYDLNSWIRQPLFLADTEDSLLFLPDDTRVQMVMDEITPLLAQATAPVKATADSHVLRRRDKLMAEMLGLSAAQVVRLEKWRVHHRRPGVTRQQTFFDLTLVLSGQTPPPPQTDTLHTIRAPARTRLQVPEHLLAQVFPWLSGSTPRPGSGLHGGFGMGAIKPSSAPFVSRQRSHSMSAAANSEDVARAERNASLRLMHELATVLLQDTAALMASPQHAQLIEDHPLFQHPLFTSRAFRDFCSYAQQALSLQHVDMYAHSTFAPPPHLMSPVEPPMLHHPMSMPAHHHNHQLPTFSPHTGLDMLSTPQASFPPLSAAAHPHRASMSSESLMAFPKPEHHTTTSFMAAPFPMGRSRRHTFETIGEEDSMALAQVTAATAAVFSPAHSQAMPQFNPMLLSQPLSFPPQLHSTMSSQSAATSCQPPAIAFPQLAEEPEPEPAADPMSQQCFMQFIDYLSVYNQQQQSQTHGHPGFFQPPMLPTVNSQSLLHGSMIAANQVVSGTAPTHFPRLASESSETTASPEPATAVNSHHQQQSMFIKHAAHGGDDRVYHPHHHRPSFTTPPSLLLAPAALTAAAAMAMSTAQNTGPLPLADQNSLSLYFSNAASPANTTGHHHHHQDYIDPTSTLVNSTASPSHQQQHMLMMSNSKSLHASSSSSSLSQSSSSPTPTPPTSSSAVASAMQFSVAPHKMQFKNDHELYLQ
ncbi:hypothetical protein GGI19_002134 [Coemansia pectinata]|uniref:Ndc10 domain-containing protein n=1 Tax=Coemansia pectinata TaxID=1052879 RepID=A0A9W8H095_9FUNG|nr:hypothetical protein GGI19_002134 [Coemansia pectinata]